MARAWANGTLNQARATRPDLVAEADYWGISLPELPDTPDDVGVWAEHLPAVEAFLSVQTQWRTRGGELSPVVAIGLDYPAVDVGLRRAGIDLSPRGWNDLQTIERAAIAALNED